MTDMRSDITLQRKANEVNAYIGKQQQKLAEAAEARRREELHTNAEEQVDMEADAAFEEEGEFYHKREKLLEQIEDLHEEVDERKEAMDYWDDEIQELWTTVIETIKIIQKHEEERKVCLEKADKTGAAAHKASIAGLNERMLGLRASNFGRIKLELAEKLQKESQKNENAATKLIYQMLDCFGQIEEKYDFIFQCAFQSEHAKDAKDQLENEIASIAINLQLYKIEKEKSASRARKLRSKSKEYEDMAQAESDAADVAEKEAEHAAQEAARLEKYI